MTIHKYLRKELLFPIFSSLLALFFLAGCQKQPSLLFGSSYSDEGTGANVIQVDTSTIIMSTALVDSTSTSGTGYLQVGSYNDDYLGNITSRAYWQVVPPASLPTLDPRSTTYDSIGLILFAKTGNPYYGDTTVYQNYVVSQIDTLFQEANGQIGWFSNDSLPLGPALGSASVRIFPNLNTALALSNTSQGTGDTVRIPMDKALGQQLYTMIYNKSDTITNGTKWQRWFHGLCLSPDVSSGVANLIYGFKDSAIMRIYYRQNGVISTGAFIDFPIGSKAFQFNNVITHYGGNGGYQNKPVDSLLRPTQRPQIPPLTTSTHTKHVSFVQTIGGLNVKLTFPNITSIALRPDYIGLLRASLIVRPVPGSFSTTWRLPPAVGIYSTDQNNTLLSPIPALGAAGTQTGALQLDYFHPLNTVYSYDVTAYIKAALLNSSPTARQSGLMLTIPSSNTAFNRLIIPDQTYPVDQRITLNIYYISLYPHQ
ncbi:MAG TPA: DUF4270 family protein [Puia sp.]|uniref:DUF4270 family protein n=1 Tax=Puia sp. TaxID=2045100 RepID=UPI002C859F6B|nr:DUF4270 family protein [Puia sp.]HVU97038.1 DUF4270 family protein [Puia sp.]